MLPPSPLPADFGAAVEGRSASRAALAAGKRVVGVTGKRMGSHRGSGVGFGAGGSWHRSHQHGDSSACSHQQRSRPLFATSPYPSMQCFSEYAEK